MRQWIAYYKQQFDEWRKAKHRLKHPIGRIMKEPTGYYAQVKQHGRWENLDKRGHGKTWGEMFKVDYCALYDEDEARELLDNHLSKFVDIPEKKPAKPEVVYTV